MNKNPANGQKEKVRDLPYVHVRLPVQLFAKLERIAEKEHRSLGRQARLYLQPILEKLEDVA